MRVIGTAGHVDHGKSTLVTALTGMNPDRLKEEQQREMTIELGFAWMTLPGGEEVGIVDVPGHRDFIENMLAGVGSIDAVLFVIAADEGVMPQTREHLAILDILQISKGVIALTKIDMIDDPDWIALVEDDVRKVVQGTVLENAPLIPVSARSGQGLDTLVQALANCVAATPPRPDFSRPRLWLDRIFTISGFGTVVTGTLIDGKLQTGDDIQILPSGLRGRIRGLQSHKKKEEAAYPGSRTAVNISGIDVDQIQRGEILVKPGQYRLTRRIDVYFRLLKDASLPVHHNMEVKFFLGSAEIMARLRLLGVELLKPGEEGWLQLELEQPVVAMRGDRYILRRPSPGETIGGGSIIDPQPARRYKRFSEAVIQQLERMRSGSPPDLLLQASTRAGIMPLKEIVKLAHISYEQAQAATEQLVSDASLILLEDASVEADSDRLVVDSIRFEALTQQARREVTRFHAAFPLRKGLQREELKSRLKLTARQFNALLRKWVEEGIFQITEQFIFLPQHEVTFTPGQKESVRALLAEFERDPFSPPSVKESQQAVGEEVYNALLDHGHLVQVSAEVVFEKSAYDRLVQGVRQHFLSEEEITVAQFRDKFSTSRKYALAFLEHLDQVGITMRLGDVRRLKKRS
jgi:selenocysteine-specific elongation factor